MPHQMSGGEQQGIAIARALLNDPDVILADEPTGNLDPDTTLEVMKLLRRISENGQATIIGTAVSVIAEGLADAPDFTSKLK